MDLTEGMEILPRGTPFDEGRDEMMTAASIKPAAEREALFTHSHRRQPLSKLYSGVNAKGARIKEFVALAIAATLSLYINMAFAGTAPGDNDNNGGKTAPPNSQLVIPPPSASAGIVGAATFAAAALVYVGVAFARRQNHPLAPYSRTAAMADRRLSGRIVSVNAAANGLVILTKQGEMALDVDPAAKIKVGKESQLADLETGSKVKVSYKIEDTCKVATRIW